MQSTFLFVAVCLFVAMGVLFTFTIPPFQIPDEASHWSSAVTRAERFFAAITGRPFQECSVELGLPAQMDANNVAMQSHHHMPRDRFSTLRGVKRNCERVIVPYGNLLTYPGVFLSKIILRGEEKKGRIALVSFYMSRLLHGAMVSLFLFRFVSLARTSAPMPIGAAVLSTLIISPLFVQQSFGVSADPICFSFALSLLTFSLFPSRVTRFDVGVAMLVALVACHTKPPMLAFFPCAALVGLRAIPYRAYTYCVVGIGLAAVMGALAVSFAYNTTGEIDPFRGKYISPIDQLKFAVENPQVVLAAVDSVVWQLAKLKHLAHPLGWLDTKLHKRALSLWYNAFDIGLFLDVVGLCLLRWKAALVPKPLRSFGFAMVALVGIYIATLTTPLILFLTWTEVGAHGVAGMQSRYLFPSLLLLPIVPAAFLEYRVKPEGAGDLCKWSVIGVGVLMVLFSVLYLAELYISLAARYW